MLKRLTNFKVQHKNKAGEDAQRMGWQEEDTYLRRESLQLTKDIQVCFKTELCSRSGKDR